MQKAGSRQLRRKCSVSFAFAGIAAFFFSPIAGKTDDLRPYTIENDAIAQPLTTQRGDAARGRSVIADRQTGLCLLCHTGPFPEQRFQGTLAPDLRGAAARLTEGQIRLRVVDSGKLNPDTIMPAYYRIDGRTRVGSAWVGKPILTAQQIEDAVAFLMTLKDAP